MNQDEIFDEIRACFTEPFRGDVEFPFKVLQSAGAGAKSLIVPSLSPTYEWKAKEIASSGEAGLCTSGPRRSFRLLMARLETIWLDIRRHQCAQN